MKCKYCDAELANWGGFCPVCGKRNDEEPEQTVPPVEQLDLPSEQEVTAEPVTQAEAPSPQLKKAKRLAAMSGCVALLAVLATVLFFGIRGGWDFGKWFKKDPPRGNDLFYKDSYTVTDKTMQNKADVVVATMGQAQLTNVQLQFYYWTEVYDFMSQYGYYLSYIGFDYTKPLSDQTCYFDNTMTWEQYFLNTALEVWQSNVAFAQLAESKGFTMPEDYQESLDGMAEELTETAKKQGYSSVDAMVQESFGAGCTLEDYLEYMEVYYLGYTYFAELYNAIDPSVEELTAYYEANKATFEENNIKQDGSYTVHVRHILSLISNVAEEMGAKKDADGKYSEEVWEACREEAQKIYDLYLAGELTEEHFGELANEYSDDQDGEVTNGGLYENVFKGDMVEAFDAWLFEEGRQVGDTGLVKTEYGYHVMYFAGTEDVWLVKARNAYVSEQSNEIVADTLKQFAAGINYKKIVLGEVKL